MGEPCSGFGPSAHRRPGQGPDIALDERLIHVGNGIAVLGQPLPKLIAGTQHPSDTVWGLPVLGQGGSEGIEVGTQQPALQLGDHRRPSKALLDHRLLLLP
jgi:hypothetical protein